MGVFLWARYPRARVMPRGFAGCAVLMKCVVRVFHLRRSTCHAISSRGHLLSSYTVWSRCEHGSEAGSNLRSIDLYHSTLGSKMIKKKKVRGLKKCMVWSRCKTE